MQIEEGKYYKTRDGRKIGPMRRSRSDEFISPWFWTDGDFAWKNDGSYSEVTPDHNLSLVAEWPTGPVVTETVTKTRIVPGTYSNVTVMGPTSAVQLQVYTNLHDPSPDELDAAAAVLSALAKGLRDA